MGVAAEPPTLARAPLRSVQRVCAGCASRGSPVPCPVCGQTNHFRDAGNLLSPREGLLPTKRVAPIQAKLRVNPADDIYEKEADRAADTVVNSPPAAARGAVRTKPLVRVNGIIQRQSSAGIEAGGGLEEPQDEFDGTALQMKGSSNHGPEISSAQQSRVDSLRGGGQPLSERHRSFFGPLFGYDFGAVRIHDDALASKSASDFGARAYTTGRDIVFASGEFQPDSHSGMRLLAHELTHVVQQNAAASDPVQRDVLQRDEGQQPIAKTCPPVPSTPSSAALKTVQIYLSDRLVIADTVGGERFYMLLNAAQTDIAEGSYSAVHSRGQEVDCITGVGFQWRFEQDPKTRPRDWAAIPPSAYALIVSNSAGVFDDAGKAGAKDKNTGKGGAIGSKDDQKNAPGAKARPHDGNKGGDESGGTGAAADDQKILAAFQKQLGEVGSPTTVPSDPEVAAILKDLTESERDDLARFLRNSQMKAEDEGTGFDPKEVIKSYKNLSPADRELLRTNLELAKSTTGANELPQNVKIALDTGAEASSTQITQQVDALNSKLGELARIHASVNNPMAKKEDLEPIDLNKLPVFADMMMLEGLLAGASAKSPEIQAIAKELTASIGGIRDYVLEEIAWLVAEMAVSEIFSALLAPVTAGLSEAAEAGEAAYVLKRLHDLREFLLEVEKIYDTITTIRAVITQVIGAYDAYKNFRAQYEKWSSRLEKLQSLLEKASADSDDIDKEIEELEDQMIEELQKSLDDPAGLGGLLEHFFIPADATEDDLKEILFNIPRGIDAFRELVSFYGSFDRTKIEDVKILAYKGVRAGALLYPFVGYLALFVSNQLSSLMAHKDLSDRLLDMIGRAAQSSKIHGSPSKKDNREKLKKVKKSKDKPKKKDAKKAKDATDKAKGKGKDKGKKKDEDKGKKDSAKQPDEDEKKKEDEDPKKKAAHEEAEKQDAEWQLVLDKVAQLPSGYASDGATKTDLLKAARKISTAHKTVSGGPKILEVADKAYWAVTILRKGAANSKASAEVLMNDKMRLKKGLKAIEAKVASLRGTKMDKSSVAAAINPLKEPYGFKTLHVGDRKDGRQGMAVFGAVGKGAENVLTNIDDTTNMHFGTQGDPIPVNWYKHENNYPGSIKLTVDGKSQSFPINSPQLLTRAKKAGDVDIFVGIDMNNIVKEGTVMKRKSTKRSGTKQDDYRKALKAAGFDWTGKDADHVRDLAFEGKDDFDNLWPLDSKINRWAYTGDWYRTYGIEYRDQANPQQANSGTLYTLRDKYFRVIGFATEPLKLGGKTDKWRSPDTP